MEAGDPPAPVGLHAKPFRNGGSAQPIGAVAPLWPTGGVIDRFQHLPIRHPFGPRIDDGHRGGLQISGNDPGRQRLLEAEHNGLAVVERVVRHCCEDECRLGGESRDIDALRHARIVGGGGTAARLSRQSDLR